MYSVHARTKFPRSKRGTNSPGNKFPLFFSFTRNISAGTSHNAWSSWCMLAVTALAWCPGCSPTWPLDHVLTRKNFVQALYT